jgi:hypothetical protein
MRERERERGRRRKEVIFMELCQRLDRVPVTNVARKRVQDLAPT